MTDRRVTAIAVAVERRKGGRPRLSESGSERVDIRLPLPLYDAVCREALRHDIPLATLIRRVLSGFVGRNQPDPPNSTTL